MKREKNWEQNAQNKQKSGKWLIEKMKSTSVYDSTALIKKIKYS